jgi:hypothetical protein
MPRTLGIMLSWSTYGKWLRGDARGSVREGTVLPPDPVLEAADRRRLRFEPFTFPRELRHRAGTLIGEAARKLNLAVHALHIGRWHLHTVIGYAPVPLPRIVKSFKDAVRRGLGFRRPIWVAGYDHRFCFDVSTMLNRVEYVRRHNREDGLPQDPWDFTVPLPLGG